MPTADRWREGLGRVGALAALVVSIAAYVRAGAAEPPGVIEASGIEIVGASGRTVLSIRAAGEGAVFLMSDGKGRRIGMRIDDEGAKLDLADGANSVLVAVDGEWVRLSAAAGDPAAPTGAIAVLTPTQWMSSIEAGGQRQGLVLPRSD